MEQCEMLTATDAMRQASMTMHDYAQKAVDDLCGILNIDMTKPKWREELAPFSPVLAAMVTGCVRDFELGLNDGVRQLSLTLPDTIAISMTQE
jgi:hypothetical protein